MLGAKGETYRKPYHWCTVSSMFIGSLVWSIVIGLIFGYTLYYFSWTTLNYHLARIAIGYSYRRFRAFYEVVAENYAEFASYGPTKLNRVEFLYAFETYDLDRAYHENRSQMRHRSKKLLVRGMAWGFLIVVAGMLLSSLPGYVFLTMIIFYTGRVAYETRWLSNFKEFYWPISNELFVQAYFSVYGFEKAMAMLTTQQPAATVQQPPNSSVSIFGRIVAINTELWSDGRWKRTMLCWIAGIIALGILPQRLYSVPLVSDMLGTVELLYIFSIGGSVVYFVQSGGWHRLLQDPSVASKSPDLEEPESI